MLKLIGKFSKHGIKGILLIAKVRFLSFIKYVSLRLGKYEFSSNKLLIKLIEEKVLSYIKSLNTNSNIFKSGREKYSGDDLTDFYLLGNNFQFPDKINWSFNSINFNKEYPAIFEKEIKIYDYERYGDYRITWELNRHHHFVWFAQKYFLSNDEYFAEELTKQTLDWIDSNKVGYGVNFVSAMEISIRLVNWIVSFIITNKARTVNLVNDKIINSILGQSLYLYNNLSIFERKFRNNHSIVELASLALLQSILKWEKLPGTEKLLEYLLEELKTQFYDDGINFEHSPTYSRFTIESLLILLILYNGDRDSKNFNTLFFLTRKYVLSLRTFLTPEGSVPLFSDCDNGRILFLEGTNKNFNSFKGFFDFCGIYFNDESLFVSESSSKFSEETNWGCFLSGFNIENRKYLIKTTGSFFYPNSGYYIYSSEDIFIAFKCGYLGNKNLDSEYAPHVHNDLLSFELFWNNKPLLVDSGTYTYNVCDNGFRDYFRSIYAHNSIAINGKNQFEFFESFGAKNLPKTRLFKINKNHVRGEIFHGNEIQVAREIKIENNSVYFFDELKNLPESSTVEIILNFHNLVQLIEKKEQSLLIGNQKGIFEIDFNYPCLFEEQKGWVSDSYNIKYSNTKIIVKFYFESVHQKIEWRIKKTRDNR